jgi:hypothetical protein
VLATSQEIMPIARTLTAVADVDIVLVQRLECRQEETARFVLWSDVAPKGANNVPLAVAVTISMRCLFICRVLQCLGLFFKLSNWFQPASAGSNTEN